MNHLTPTDALIDLAQIWSHEQDRYFSGKGDEVLYKELYEDIRFFYLAKQHPAFISPEIVLLNPDLKQYYKNYEQRLALQSTWKNYDFFEHKGAFYDMNESCIIERQDVSADAFEKLFVLKLRQVEDTEQLMAYVISYHYYKSFQKDWEIYRNFLSSVASYEALLQQSTLDRLREGYHMSETLLSEDLFDQQLPNKNGVPLPGYRTEEEIKEEALVGITKEIICEPLEFGRRYMGWKGTIIEGNLRPEQIQHFFSFLYRDRGEVEGSYLTKEQVDYILKDGLLIPDEPLKEKYSLNYSLRYSKNLANYFIWKFIQEHGAGTKAKVLVFLGCYIEEYAKALYDRTYDNLSKNITGTEVKKASFKIEDYLP